MDRERLLELLKGLGGAAEPLCTDRAWLELRPGPHAPYSTAPQLIRASAASAPGLPFAIHVAEGPEEKEFVAYGTGPIAGILDDLGINWRWWDPVGMTPVAYLDALGVLGPRCLLVHGLEVEREDQELIAARGATLCLCPRSNRWISGRLPDVPGYLEAGVRLCLGTDSLASNASLDLLEEVVELSTSFPDLPIAGWLSAATENGASVMGFESLGRVEPGCSPGLLWLPDTPDLESLGRCAPRVRRWLVKPRGRRG
jgi:cytosine/adenosine deaminase-related metal-dependent hydrolase